MRVPSCTVQATPVASGIAIGRVMLIHKKNFGDGNTAISADEVQLELERFHTALEVTKKQLQDLQEKLRRKLRDTEAGIFDAHLLLVEDYTMTNEVERSITEDMVDAESAIIRAVDKFVAAFSAVEDIYLRERAVDIRDVGQRIITNLSEGEEKLD